MKTFYALIVVCFGLGFTGNAQTWTGAPGGLWSVGSNWSGGSVPAPNANITLNNGADILLDSDPFVGSVSVSGAVKITATGARELTLNGTLTIPSGSILRDSTLSGSAFFVGFGSAGKANIGGTWYFSAPSSDEISTFYDPTDGGASVQINVNTGGTIQIANGGLFFPNQNGNSYINFAAGSFLQMSGDQPFVSRANYNASSTIFVSGVKDQALSFDANVNSIGNLTYACPNQSEYFSMGLQSINILGNLFITNTNNQKLSIFPDIPTGAAGNKNVNLSGSLQIINNSNVLVASSDAAAYGYTLNIGGNLIINGTGFDIQDGPSISTNVVVSGNIQHLSGTFTASSMASSNTLSYYNIELNGSGTQSISSVTGILDNNQNQINLRIRKASGVVNLGSDISVGRLEFATGNNGNINTGANTLSVRNNVTASPSIALVRQGNGFVIGNLRRNANAIAPLLFPLGSGSTYRGLTISPTSATPSTYSATFTNSNQGSTPAAPIDGVAPYYWTVNKITGSNATVELTLNGAVPGALNTHALVATKVISSTWANAKGSTGTSIIPGDATTGTVRTEMQTTFGFYTIGYGSQAALPTVLRSFSAKKVSETNVDLVWKITENSTPEHFAILRSEDGIAFDSIGSLKGIKGELNYKFTDKKILAGNNYYKLKMYDKDGALTYSTIAVVMNGTKGVIISAIMPTIVQDRARLAVSSSLRGTLQLVITDISGRIIQNQNVSIDSGNQDVWLTTNKLSAGMFQVTGYVNGEKTTTLRFIKQ